MGRAAEVRTGGSPPYLSEAYRTKDMDNIIPFQVLAILASLPGQLQSHTHSPPSTYYGARHEAAYDLHGSLSALNLRTQHHPQRHKPVLHFSEEGADLVLQGDEVSQGCRAEQLAIQQVMVIGILCKQHRLTRITRRLDNEQMHHNEQIWETGWLRSLVDICRKLYKLL